MTFGIVQVHDRGIKSSPNYHQESCLNGPRIKIHNKLTLSVARSVSFCRLFALAAFLKREVGLTKIVKMTVTGSKNEHQPEDIQNKAEENKNLEDTVSSGDWNDKTESTRDKKHKDQHKLKKDRNLEKIAELEAIIAENRDRHLRLQAEFDNFRKRTLKEKAELIKSGGESVIMKILPVVDDFERALATMQEVPEEDPAKIGFLLIFNKFRDFLKQNSVKEIAAVGLDFDVDHHFALSKVPAPSEELKGKIVDVVEKGYTLHDKVIRFAKVIIGE